MLIKSRRIKWNYITKQKFGEKYLLARDFLYIIFEILSKVNKIEPDNNKQKKYDHS